MKKIINLWLQTLLLINLFIFLFVFYFSTIDQHKFHIDEYLFLKKSYFFDLFLKRDFQNQLWWQENFNQPRLGPYIYGLSLRLKGIKDIEGFQRQIGFNQIKIKDYFWWEALLWEKPADFPLELNPVLELIVFGRKVATVFGFSCLLILLIWALLIKNIQFGFWAILLLGFNRLMFYYSRTAMTDAFLAFFFFTNLIWLTLYLKSFFQKDKRQFLFLSIAIGATAAAAAGVKVIGILSLIYALAINLFLFLVNRRERKLQAKTLAYSFLLIIFIFYFLFLSLNPQLYSQPLRGFWQMFSSRWQSAIDYQKQGARSVDNKLEGLVLIFEKIFLPGNKFGNFGWLPLIPLDLIVFSLGGGLLVGQIKERLKTKRPLGLQFILATWWWSCFLSLVFYLKSDWPRFYLPLVTATTLIQAYFFSWIPRWFRLIFKGKSRVLVKILRSVMKLKFLA